MRPSSALARTAQAGLARRRAAALSSLASVAPMSSATSSSRAPRVMLQAVAPASRAVGTGVLPSGACGRRCMSSVAERATTVAMPALSPTMTNGKIAKWNKKEGDAVNSGDTLCEVETDKATVDFTYQDDMILAKILIPEGTEGVAVGTVMAIMVERAEDLAAVQAMDWSAPAGAGSGGAPLASTGAGASSGPAGAGAARAEAAAAAPAAPSSAAAAVAALDASAVMPSARLLMANEGVAPSAVKGTGKDGRITKGDVLVHLGRIPPQALHAAAAPAARAASAATAAPTPAAASAAPAASAAAPSVAFSGAALRASAGGWAPGPAPKAPAPATPASLAAAFPNLGYTRPGAAYTDTKPSQVRKVIAARLTESKAGVPHQYAVMDVQLDALLALRASLKAAGVTVSVNDMVIKAAAKALRDVPEANCFYDARTDSVQRSAGVDVSVAVATEGGLITPIVKGADALGLTAINGKVKELAGRARLNKLKPEEFQGGTFTISNLGMFGAINEFTAVINPPQACILAVGKGEKRVLGAPLAPGELDSMFAPATGAGVGAAAPASVGEPRIAEVMSVQLSADARVVEPHIAGQFLQAFRQYIQEPALLVA